jgi:hypothetical protein
MDRMAEEGSIYSGSITAHQLSEPISTSIYRPEWWSTVDHLIERRQIIIPNDEKLIAQLTSRRKLYDSKGRERLESKADLKARGVESPDRADAVMMRLAQDQFAFDPVARQQFAEMTAKSARLMERHRSPFYEPHVDFSGW